FKPVVIIRIFRTECFTIRKNKPDMFHGVVCIELYTTAHAACIIRNNSTHHCRTDTRWVGTDLSSAFFQISVHHSPCDTRLYAYTVTLLLYTYFIPVLAEVNEYAVSH